MGSRRLATLLCVLSGVTVSACGDDRVETGGLEDELRSAVEERLGIAVKSVDCPDDVRVREGGRFECRFTTLAGESDVVAVVQRGGELSYQLPPTQ